MLKKFMFTLKRLASTVLISSVANGSIQGSLAANTNNFNSDNTMNSKTTQIDLYRARLKAIKFDGVPSLTEEEQKNIVLNADLDCKVPIMGFTRKLSINEKNIREYPDKYFRQNKNSGECYVRDELGKWHSAGKFTIANLGDLSIANTNSFGDITSNKLNSNKLVNDKLVIAYGRRGANGTRNLLDVQKALDCPIFDIFNPASNHNAVETTGPDDSDITKFLAAYPFDKTQGPAMMIKCCWTSLCLLHMPGLGGKEYISPGVYKERSKAGINLLDGYGVETTNGYLRYDFSAIERKGSIVSGKIDKCLGEACDRDDAKFKCLLVEDVPVYFTGGDIWSGTPYGFDKSNRKIHLMIDAAIPSSHNPCGYTFATDDACKNHLRRHYLAFFNYCRVKGIKRAMVSLMGAGVFGNLPEWHVEILNDKEVRRALDACETRFLINAYDNCDSDLWKKVKGAKVIDVSEYSDWSQVLNVEK